MIRVCEPNVGIDELVNINLALMGGWLTTGGKYCNELERLLSVHYDVPYSIVVSSGTAALHLALLALGVGPGDEVIVPSFSFVAVASMTRLAGADPIIVDVESDTWLIDLREINRHITSRTKAIIVVDLYGNVCNVDNIRRIAPGIPVIVDACESLGVERKSIGDILCSSFQSTKIITTGEGGACVTSSKVLSDKIRFLKDHAMNSERKYYHSQVGFNYRLTNIQAAVGVAQFKRLGYFLSKKAQISQWYRESLSGLGIGFQKYHELGSQWVFPILVENRDSLMLHLQKKGIETRVVFYPINLQPPYVTMKNNDCPVSLRLSNNGMYLPSGTKLTYSEINKVCKAIKEWI
jgi:perosamine synthetase